MDPKHMQHNKMCFSQHIHQKTTHMSSFISFRHAYSSDTQQFHTKVFAGYKSITNLYLDYRQQH